MLADYRIVANHTGSILAFPTEILRIGADDSTLIYFNAFSESSTTDNRGVWLDLTSVTDNSTGIYVCERMNCYVLAEPGGRVYVS